MRGQAIPVDDVDQLLRSDEGRRRAWLHHRQPAALEANWWLGLLVLIDQQWADRPAERVAWVELKLWLLDQARERSVLSRRDVAERRAYFVSQMRDAGMAPAILPSADTVVRDCLAAIPVSVEQVAVLSDHRPLHALTHGEMLDSRRAKNLVNAAKRHLNDIEDPDLARRLREWLAIEPRLV